MDLDASDPARGNLRPARSPGDGEQEGNHCQRELGRVIVEKGGEHLFQINLIRSHWAGVENRNHWRRDAIWDEDGTRSRKPNIVGNLALLRSAAIRSIHHHYPDR